MNVAQIGPALLLAGAAFFAGVTAARPATPACEKVKVAGDWCAAGKVGYVAGVEIRSHALFETLDTHGHDIDPVNMPCKTCSNALRTDGFCVEHRMGFVKGGPIFPP